MNEGLDNLIIATDGIIVETPRCDNESVNYFLRENLKHYSLFNNFC